MEDFHSEILADPLPLSSSEGSGRKIIVDLIETLVISLVLFAVINFVSARIRVESVSMRETLAPGDFVLVNRLAYVIGDFKTGDIDRGDIVVFNPPFDSVEPYVKRVIGLPGEEVSIQGGDVYVNGVLLQEPYIQAHTRSNGSWEIPQGEIFVMGDNRNNSSDSRSWGTVPIQNIIGKALFVYWPINQWGALASSAVAAESTTTSP